MDANGKYLHCMIFEYVLTTTGYHVCICDSSASCIMLKMGMSTCFCELVNYLLTFFTFECF